MQAAYWVGRHTRAPLGGVSAHLYAEFDGAGLDADRLRVALARLHAAHPMLRLRVTPEGRQTVAPCDGTPRLHVDDLSALNAHDLSLALQEKRRAKAHQRLALDDGNAADVSLSRLPGGRARLHVDADMIAVDPGSFRLLMEDLALCYEGNVPVPGPPVSYFDYLDRLQADADSARQRERDAAWWRLRLEGVPPPPRLPWCFADGTARHVNSIRLTAQLAPAERTALRRAARRRHLTLSMLMLGLFAATLGAGTGSERFRLNVPLFHRSPSVPEAERIIGDFSNLLILGVARVAQEPLAALCRRIAQDMAQLITHSAYPGVSVMRDLSRHHGDMQVSPVVFTAGLDIRGHELFSERVTRLFGEMVWTSSQGPHVALDAQVASAYGGILINWDVRLDALPEPWIHGLFDAYVALARRVAREPEALDRPFPPPQPADTPAPAVALPAAPFTERMLRHLISRLAPSGRDAPGTDIPALGLDNAARDELLDFLNTYVPGAALSRDTLAEGRTTGELARLIRARSNGASETVAQALIEALEAPRMSA